MYRLFGMWNDRSCDRELAYMCKKEKERLPAPPEEEVIDEGCDPGWKAFSMLQFKHFQYLIANLHIAEVMCV